MSNTSRIDAFATDTVVLITIGYLNTIHNPTSNKTICDHYHILQPDAVKDSLKRLKKGGLITQVKGGRGITPVYEIHTSAINDYFENSIPSESTRYRSFQKLAEYSLLRYDNETAHYVFDARGFLKYIQDQGVNIDQLLASLRKAAMAYFKHSIPKITVKRFIAILDGQPFTFDGPLLRLVDGVLELSQKALCSS